MNLAIDFGNTRIKAATFQDDQIDDVTAVTHIEPLKKFITDRPIERCIVASVTREHEALLPWLQEHFETTVFTNQLDLPIANHYRSALTLGSDRFAVAIGGYAIYPSQPVLTIDAGTCIKYNFVNSLNEYIGGAISPGIPMRLNAMHQFTSALPHVEPEPSFDALVGTSTRESLLSGAINGAAFEAEGMIAAYRQQHEHLKVLVTGGDAPYLTARLKSTFFAHPHLLLTGLNTVLNFQFEK